MTKRSEPMVPTEDGAGTCFIGVYHVRRASFRRHLGHMDLN